ncbi:MAG TPA: hypothetical protein VKE96_35010 [Vicinamibacterales bacterium]|nr:hypothetical protein [Vicinamibacterales bacterium]
MLRGQPRPGEGVLRRPIYDDSGHVVLDASASSQESFQNPGYVKGHTDNHLVRLKNGTLLAMKTCEYWKTPENPMPWQAVGSPVPYNHGTQVFWYPGARLGASFDWSMAGVADPFVFEGGKYGYPQAIDSSGNRLTLATLNESGHWNDFASWKNAGSDRPELYACPFTGYLYLAAYFESGAYNGSDLPKDQWPDARSDDLVLYSADNAKSWNVLFEVKDRRPIVMTSTPNGRLFLYQWTYNKEVNGAVLWCSNRFDAIVKERPLIGPQLNGWAHKEVGDSANGYTLEYNNGVIRYTERVNGKTLTISDADPELSTKVNAIRHPAISRVSTDTSATSIVRVTYPLLNEYGRMTVVILEIEVVELTGESDLAGPETGFKDIRRVGRIESDHTATHSIVHGTFVDPDYISMPSGVHSNTSLFYWLDWPAVTHAVPTTENEMSARYSICYGNHEISPTNPLSVTNGQLRTWPGSNVGGDYLDGGFFYWNGLNYVAQWVEPAGIRANIVYSLPIPFPIFP